MTMSSDRAELVPIGEAARILGVSVDTLRRWESKGIIAATRTPLGQRRFATSEIERVAAGRHDPPPLTVPKTQDPTEGAK